MLDNKHRAFAEGCRRAVERLPAVDLAARCAALGLPMPEAGRIGPFRWFDHEVVLTVDGALESWDRRAPARQVEPSWSSAVPGSDCDRLILLHALLGDGVARDSGRWVTFRSFPGGAFYWQPYQRRCVDPLAHALRSADDLRGRLGRFEHRAITGGGEVAVCVTAFGRVGLGLTYSAVDDEFPASADVLFDPSLVGILCAEDASALAGILCTRIHSHPCATCTGCALCA